MPPTGAGESTRTVAGAVIGTAVYMSPEQAEGKLLDARSDVFSFGAVLYELLSGRRAFDGESTAQVVSAVLRDDPPRSMRFRRSIESSGDASPNGRSIGSRPCANCGLRSTISGQPRQSTGPRSSCCRSRT